MSGPTPCGCARRSSGAPGRTPRGGRDSSSLQRSGSCGGSASPRWRAPSRSSTWAHSPSRCSARASSRRSFASRSALRARAARATSSAGRSARLTSAVATSGRRASPRSSGGSRTGALPDGALPGGAPSSSAASIRSRPPWARSSGHRPQSPGSPRSLEGPSWLRAPYWGRPAAPLRARLDVRLRERPMARLRLRDFLGAVGLVPADLQPTARELNAQLTGAAATLGEGSASPRLWSERFAAALSAAGWPGPLAADGVGQQTRLRWHELLDELGGLTAGVGSLAREEALRLVQELASRTPYR